MRYKNQEVFVNAREAYKRYLKKTRGIESVRQYNTPTFKHPAAEQVANLNVVNHIWKTGDRYYKLSEKYYNDPTLWWVIALYNQKPTEFHLKLGDVVFVPLPLESVLFHMGY